MNILYTIDEKYMKVVEKISFRKYAKAKLLLEEILEKEPGYGKAHFQLACIYLYDLDDYVAADYHFRLAIKFEPSFPHTYLSYVKMLNMLRKHEDLLHLADKALKVRGVCESCIYNEMGLSYEQKKNWVKALECYSQAIMHALDSCDIHQLKDNQKRAQSKQLAELSHIYNLI